MKLRTITLLGGILCALLVIGVAVAESSLDLSWFQIGASGRRVSGGGLVLESSVGQSVNERVLGGGLELQSGFLTGVQGPTPTITPGGPTLTPTATPTVTLTPGPPQFLPLIFKGA